MTAYLTPETAEALRKPAEEALERIEAYFLSRGIKRSFSADCAAVRHALRAAQAQADAPPPPDVEAAHNALDGIVESFADLGVPEETAVGCVDIVRRALPPRAAMHKLPKEE